MFVRMRFSDSIVNDLHLSFWKLAPNDVSTVLHRCCDFCATPQFFGFLGFRKIFLLLQILLIYLTVLVVCLKIVWYVI